MEGVSLQDPGIFYPFCPKTPDRVRYALGENFQGEKVEVFKVGRGPLHFLPLPAADLYHEGIEVSPDLSPLKGTQLESGIGAEFFLLWKMQEQAVRILQDLLFPLVELGRP